MDEIKEKCNNCNIGDLLFFIFIFSSFVSRGSKGCNVFLSTLEPVSRCTINGRPCKAVARQTRGKEVVNRGSVLVGPRESSTYFSSSHFSGLSFVPIKKHRRVGLKYGGWGEFSARMKRICIILVLF